MMRGLTVAFVLIAGSAQAGTPLRPLQLEATRTAAAATTARNAQIALHDATLARFVETAPAVEALRQAQDMPANEKTLATAMDQLARVKAAYDAASNRERAGMIASVQAEAAARAARQALTDAVNTWSAEGEALEHAAQRAGSGEVARTARENTACLDQDCSPVSAREHSALVLMGAVGPVFDAKDWPDEAAREMTLLAPSAAATPRLRGLRDAREAATKASQQATTAASTARANFEAPLPNWQARLYGLLESYFHPPKETSVPDAARAFLDFDANVRANAEANRSATQAADAAKAAVTTTEARLNEAVDAFADMGRATRRAALLAGRGNLLRADGTAICLAERCAATSGVEAAAFVVIGAAAPGAELKFANLIEQTPDRGWVFKPPR